MRTALSRMVTAGEVDVDTGWYHLTGRLLERQHAQDVGRRPPATAWDGRWHTAIAAADQRGLADRRQFRSALTDHRFGELRPDTWLRPANLPAPELGSAAFLVTGTLGRSDESALVARLWDLDAIGASAGRLLERIARLRADVDLTRPRRDPRDVHGLGRDRALPAERTAAAVGPHLADWPVHDLRRAYDDLERDLQATLRDFLSADRG
jgi:phenylacetic acid degradation operon negative regulatory protein